MLNLFLSRRSDPRQGIGRRYKALVNIAFVILGTPFASTHLAAQWIKYPTAGVPRKTDGKVDMSAPAPRMADGKPDFSGIWTTAEPNRPRTGKTDDGEKPGDQSDSTASHQMTNIGVE